MPPRGSTSTWRQLARSATTDALIPLADVTSSGGLGIADYRILGWWTWVFPGLVLGLLLVCVNLLGDGLDTALNPSRTS